MIRLQPIVISNRCKFDIFSDWEILIVKNYNTINNKSIFDAKLLGLNLYISILKYLEERPSYFTEIVTNIKKQWVFKAAVSIWFRRREKQKKDGPKREKKKGGCRSSYQLLFYYYYLVFYYQIFCFWILHCYVWSGNSLYVFSTFVLWICFIWVFYY